MYCLYKETFAPLHTDFGWGAEQALFEVFVVYLVEVIQKTFYYWLTICKIDSIFLWTSLWLPIQGKNYLASLMP